MPGRDIIVIGASAGGVQALSELMRGLRDDLPAAVFIVVHTSPSSPGILPHILDRVCELPVSRASDGEPVRQGHVYVAPPDHHMLVKDGTVRLVRGPKENGFRPAVDPLFRTAARAAGPRVIGVVLSGGLDDGTEGLAIIKRYGGVAVVQDPAEADFPSMPASAIANVDVDHVLGIAQMPDLLAQLTRLPPAEGVLAMAAKEADEGNVPDVAEIGDASLATGDLPGPPSSFTCPECGGALWELQSGTLLKYRCHVGHAYTPEGLVAEQSRALEVALWTGLRALEEYAALRRRMARRANTDKWAAISRDYERQAEDAEARAALIRHVLIEDGPRKPGAKGGNGLPRPKWDGAVYNNSSRSDTARSGVAGVKGANGPRADPRAAKARPEAKAPRKSGGRRTGPPKASTDEGSSGPRGAAKRRRARGGS